MKLGILREARLFSDSQRSQAIDDIGRLGLGGVELFCGDLDHAPFGWSTAGADELRKELRDKGLAIPSTSLGAFNIDDSLVRETGKEKAIEAITRFLAYTHAVGADVMLLCTFLQSHPDTTEKLNQLRAILQHVLPVAVDLDVIIALETPLAAMEVIDLIEPFNSSRLAVYYDTGNAIALGYDPVEEIRLLGHHVASVHVKDSRTNTLGALHLGEGDLDLSAAMGALRNIEYGGWLILETPDDTLDAQLRDVATLQALMSGA